MATAIENDEAKNEDQVADQGPRTPPLYGEKSSGMGNPFAGTSWG